MFPNIFTPQIATNIVERINNLSPATQAQWGKMNVAQMLAHCNVLYEMTFENIHKKPNAFFRFILKMIAKPAVVTEKPYKNGTHTAPQFIIVGQREFEHEKQRLIKYINHCVQLGENHFEGRESFSFGILNKTEWNNMFYKHLNHHLTQFGV